MAKKTGNPFLDNDYTQFMGFDRMEFMDFGKIAERFRMPGFDASALMETQRRNIEAITAANRITFEGVQALAQRQAEILRQAMEESAKAMRELAAAGTPEARMEKQAELAKESFELALSNIRELAEMSAKSNSEALEALNARVAESLDEIKTAIHDAAKSK